MTSRRERQEEEDPPPPRSSSKVGGNNSCRRESSRYRVEIPTMEEDDDGAVAYNKSSCRSKQQPPSSSPRRTRSDMPRRHDYANIEVAHSSSLEQKKKKKKNRSHFYDDKEEDVIIYDADKHQRRQSPQRTLRSHRDELSTAHRPSQWASSSATQQELHDGRSNKKNKTKESNSSSSSSNNKSSSSSKNKQDVNDDDDDDDKPLVPKRHFVWMPFGHVRTWTAILFMAMGITLAILAKRSTSFVTLETPLELTPHLEPIQNVGLVRMELCYSDDYMDALQGDSQKVDVPYLNSVVDLADGRTTRAVPHSPCYTVTLAADVIEDIMWQVSRLSASFSIVLGCFFCVLLISTIYWESINMKPMAVGLLVAYLLQSFSFFFYDSQLCREHTCKLATGTYLSILASFCWFGTSMVCILMDVYHTRKMRRLARLERRRRRRLRRAARAANFERKSSAGTAKTETSSNGDSSEQEEEEVLSPLPAMIEENGEVGEVFWKV